MSSEEPQPKERLPDHEPPRGATSTGTWNRIDYTATAQWLVLRKLEKASAEIFRKKLHFLSSLRFVAFKAGYT